LNNSLLAQPLICASGQLLNGLLAYYPQAIHSPDTLYNDLAENLPWQQGSILIYGKRHKIPRLQCWIADPGLNYTYSGEQLPLTPWPPLLQQLRLELNQAFDLRLNSVLCNLYRDGQDAMGWHSDNEPELGSDPAILSVTLGAQRDFALRPTGSTRQSAKIALEDGSLLYMKAGMQSLWQHAVPRRAGIRSARINLTFREIIQPLAR
tara:strand:+ start:401 stop:1021 length:621 start_codon:yes stop_codon:yes gene_type:complete